MGREGGGSLEPEWFKPLMHFTCLFKGQIFGHGYKVCVKAVELIFWITLRGIRIRAHLAIGGGSLEPRSPKANPKKCLKSANDQKKGPYF